MGFGHGRAAFAVLGTAFGRALAAPFVVAAVLLFGAIAPVHAQAPEFPPGCTLPVDWTVPVGATTGWSVASDSVYAGACSLKSNPMSDSSGSGVFNKAQIEFTRTFDSESLRFARRVSSEQKFDCLRLFVDGVQQNLGGSCNYGGLGISGNVPFALHTVAIPNGTHTIRWSYEKDFSVSSVPDAAWIDNVEIIRDLFPPACALPAGWTVPSGAAAGWAPATDSVYAGVCSLKSGAIGNLAVAQIQLIALFEAGTVSFARRVSSENFYDCMHFEIDFSEKNIGNNCGDVPYSVVSFPITAGTHTLRWTYQKDAFAAGRDDASWIDSVTLPPYTVLAAPSPPPFNYVSRTSTSATFTYSPPADDGGSPISEYIVRWFQNDILAGELHSSSLTSPFDITGLNANAYVFTLAAKNAKDRKSTRLNSSHIQKSRMPSSA